jgi:hypothetical protein
VSGGLDAGLVAAVIAFLLNALFRSPLMNAPAAAGAIVALDLLRRTGANDTRSSGRPMARGLWFLSHGLFVLGCLGLASETCAARYLAATQAQQRGHTPDWLAAEQGLDWAIRLNPFENEFRLLRAGHLLRNRRHESQALQRARADLDTVLSREPQSVLAHRLLIELATAVGKPMNAELRRATARLLELDPLDEVGLQTAWQIAALLDSDLGHAIAILQTLQEVYRLESAFLDAGLACARQGNLEAARAMLWEHAQRAPDEPRAWETLAHSFANEPSSEFELKKHCTAQAMWIRARLAIEADDLDGAERLLTERRPLVNDGRDDELGWLLEAVLLMRRNATVAAARLMLAHPELGASEAVLARFGPLRDDVLALPGMSARRKNQ